MSIDELSVMDGGKCILQLRGVRPFLSEKFDITKHKNYKYLSDANPKNAFNINKFVSTEFKIDPDKEFDYMDCTEYDEAIPAEMYGDFDYGQDDFTEDYPEDLEPI